MRASNRFAQLCATLAMAGLVAAPATAQPAAPASQPSDPPSRVGRLARVQGTVSFRTADAQQWSPATRNFPIVSGDDVWTEPQSSARIEFSASAATLAASTEFDVDQLQPSGLAATVAQGEVFLRLRRLAPGETDTVQTPRGTVTIAGDGLYEIAAGDTQAPTTVTVVEGAAQVAAGTVQLQAQAGQTASVTGAGTEAEPLQGSVEPAVRDAFLDAMLAPTQPRPASAAAAPPVVATMPGAEDLAEDGSWQASPQYGSVWYPRVASNWVPYRDGHWAYVAPWGWTWVDDEPWGYTPFHYGRWVQTGERWGWAPAYAGDEARGYGNAGYQEPVYAPALVTFLDVGLGAAAGVAIGSALHRGHDRTAWAPLGYDQPYRPWYRSSDRYVRDINRTNVSSAVANTTGARGVVNNYDRHGVTVAPTAAVVGSQRITPRMQTLSEQQAATLRPVARPEFRPVAATAGVTPAVARQLGVVPATRPAPGPALSAARLERSGALRAPAAPSNAGGLPALRAPGSQPAQARPGAPGPAILPRAAAVAAVAGAAAGLALPGHPTALPPLRAPSGTRAAQPGGARPGPTPQGPTPPGLTPPGPTPAPRAPAVAAPVAVQPARPVPTAAPRAPVAPSPVRAPTPVAQPPHLPPPVARPPAPVQQQPHVAPAPQRPVAPPVVQQPRIAPPPPPPQRVAPPPVQQPRVVPPPPPQRVVPPPIQQPRIAPPPPPAQRVAPPPVIQQPRFVPPPPRPAPQARPVPSCTRQPCR